MAVDHWIDGASRHQELTSQLPLAEAGKMATQEGVVNNRREILVALGAGALAFAVPPGASGQQPRKVWRIGFLATRQEPTTQAAFARGISDLGYVEGKNLVFERRFSEGKIERFPALAAEPVGLNVDVIVVGAGPGVRATKEATAKVPIFMAGISDPVGAGLVASLAPPGGNVSYS